ncbi:hypothetical protein LINGRAHAP2_LOCUS23323 [Linum grandiflorum]
MRDKAGNSTVGNKIPSTQLGSIKNHQTLTLKLWNKSSKDGNLDNLGDSEDESESAKDERKEEGMEDGNGIGFQLQSDGERKWRKKGG